MPTAAPEPLDEVSARALTEPMFVCEAHPDVFSDAEVVVYNEDREYLVNLAAGYCACEDAHFRKRECKHQKRARFALGELEIPAWVDLENVDDQLRRRLEER